MALNIRLLAHEVATYAAGHWQGCQLVFLFQGTCPVEGERLRCRPGFLLQGTCPIEGGSLLMAAVGLDLRFREFEGGPPRLVFLFQGTCPIEGERPCGRLGFLFQGTCPIEGESLL
jgi:hypothetical protein